MRNLIWLSAISLVLIQGPALAAGELRGLSVNDDAKTVHLKDSPAAIKISAQKDLVPLGNLSGMVISVTNGTNNPVVVEAEKTVAQCGTTNFKSSPTEEVDKIVTLHNHFILRTQWKLVRIAAAGATIGATPTIQDYLVQSGPVLGRYGTDEKRREAEQKLFGNRVVWPGDTSTGIIYFSNQANLTGATITIPVQALFDSTDQIVTTISF